MEKLLTILKSIKPEIDFTSADKLVDDGVLDSLEIVNIITEIEDNYNIEVDPNQIDPDNFQSAKTIWNMIQSLAG